MIATTGDVMCFPDTTESHAVRLCFESSFYLVWQLCILFLFSCMAMRCLVVFWLQAFDLHCNCPSTAMRTHLLFERDWTCCLKFWCLQLYITLFHSLNSVSFLLWKYLLILLVLSWNWPIFQRDLTVCLLTMEKKRYRAKITQLKSISNNWCCHKELVP